MTLTTGGEENPTGTNVIKLFLCFFTDIPDKKAWVLIPGKLGTTQAYFCQWKRQESWITLNPGDWTSDNAKPVNPGRQGQENLRSPKNWRRCWYPGANVLKQYRITAVILTLLRVKTWRHDTQHNDIHHYDSQHNDTLTLCWMSLCLVSRFIYWMSLCSDILRLFILDNQLTFCYVISFVFNII